MNLKKIKDSKEQTLIGLVQDLIEKGVIPRAIIGGGEDEDVEYSVDQAGTLPDGEYSVDVDVDNDVKEVVRDILYQYSNVYVVDNGDNWFLNICLKDGKIVRYAELKKAKS